MAKENILKNNKISNKSVFIKGMKDGIPIALGYLAVSFTFGIMAKKAGLSIFQAVILSATNVTSAGQFAGLTVIMSGSSYFEMAFTQLIVNLRYCLMSCSLSQKFDKDTSTAHRLMVAYGNTDEIFGICSMFPEKLNPYYAFGAICVAVPGWTLGTFLGALSGSILPANVLSALGVALYGMFIAIVVPPAKKNKIIMWLVIISMVASLAFNLIPVIKNISSGFKIIILTVLIAGVCAKLHPVEE